MCIINKEGKVIILVPYPAQGHVTPLLKLGSVLSVLGFQPVLVVPEFIHRGLSLHHQIPKKENNNNEQLSSSSSLLLLDDGKVSCISIPDGLDEDKPRDFFAIEMAMEKHMPIHLERYILDQLLLINSDDSNKNNVVMVVDLLASYAIDVGQRCGVEVVGFWPAMLSVYHLISAIPKLVLSSVVSSDSGTYSPGSSCAIETSIKTRDFDGLSMEIFQKSRNDFTAQQYMRIGVQGRSILRL
ncbi:glycosyltransferase [Lithospermum erythrorhizon]|uniref:Glycosyltransferase n=1 Tax=Lithospermum erythrorhizon TaxID=34254 RepID=A0AAV3NUC5_LITER